MRRDSWMNCRALESWKWRLTGLRKIRQARPKTVWMMVVEKDPISPHFNEEVALVHITPCFRKKHPLILLAIS